MHGSSPTQADESVGDFKLGQEAAPLYLGVLPDLPVGHIGGSGGLRPPILRAELYVQGLPGGVERQVAHLAAVRPDHLGLIGDPIIHFDKVKGAAETTSS